MRLFILLSFVFLGWLYWELSGGAGFRPEPSETEPTLARAAAPAERSPEDQQVAVTAAAPPVEAEAEAEALTAAAAVPVPSAESDVQATRAAPPAEGVLALPSPGAPEAPALPPRVAGPTRSGSTDPLRPTEALAALSGGPAPAPAEDEPVEAASAQSATEDEAAPVEVAAPTVERRRVTGDRVNMRGGPGTDFAVVGQMGAGEIAEVIGQQNGWLQVRTPDGQEGWMSARFLAPADG
ncbi:SH3 domain-containing protein [Rubellimicrobium sp. CFH 75288]|uniref:SH3 domain-containing protein n=1 Tax=Rubellimicrobium sp. CFH 75288 TaxID=2697034 RepID=UPI0014131111|nr:SH3 domain-containing protein [Rubellimicrobium sp. CFH 75288]NAZ37924.1 SH3 domain-containing protein [Rubellimicrobium sp. CFH 75288]